MGKNEPKPDNRRFHFQLDLPDESLPSSSGRSPSSSGKTKARPDPDRRPAHSGRSPSRGTAQHCFPAGRRQ